MAHALASGEVHVWIARPGAVPDASLARCLELLSEEERERMSRFRFERHRREALVSRALVRSTLARYVETPPEGFRYRLGPYGRPHVEPACGLHFSSTNHPELVACAVYLHEAIGVDVEPISRGDEILSVADTVFSAAELEALAALPDAARRDRAVSLWTCKEAYIKARGLGFSAPLLEITVSFPPGGRPSVDDPGGWWFQMHDVTGFRIAVAARTANEELTMVVREVLPA